MNTARNIFHQKPTQEELGSYSGIFHKINAELAAGRSSDRTQKKEDGGNSSRVIKRKVLTPLHRLGQPPQKPRRPSNVSLAKFQKRSPKDSVKTKGLKNTALSSAALTQAMPVPLPARELQPASPASHLPLQSLEVPSLPLRNIKSSSETISSDNQENYDDVDFVLLGHGDTEGGQESDTEMYEDISEMRSPMGKANKRDKEEKRRMDQEKKQQKEKEKQDQEIRKKFNLKGPIQALHQARACANHKGGKNELTVKQGEQIEIIRLTNNPEGKWLGRTKKCYGYIKTALVEIDYDSLKRMQQPSTGAAVKYLDADQEMNDIGEQDSSQSGGQSGVENTFPPPPSDQEIYHGIHDDDTVPSMSPSTEQFGKDQEDDVYDDIDSSDFPSPPPEFESSQSASPGKHKQTPKNVGREEREFRKKIQFGGEIKVPYSTSTVRDFPQRISGFKDLEVKPRESLGFREDPEDNKALCRNKQDGYALQRSLVQDEGEIYDDICDDSIYDNE